MKKFRMQINKLPSPHDIALLALMTMLGIAFFIKNPALLAWHSGLILGTGMLMHGIWKKGIRKDLFLKDTMISLLILTLLLEPAFSYRDMITNGLVAALSIALRAQLRVKSLPALNPAAASLVVLSLVSLTGFLESPLTSWWGANYSFPLAGHILPIGTIISVVTAILLMIRLKKERYILTALLCFWLLLLGILPSAFENVFLDGTLYFFVGFMAIEPKTAPVTKQHQYIVAVGLTIALALFFVFELGIAYLLALIGANILTLMLKRQRPTLQKTSLSK